METEKIEYRTKQTIVVRKDLKMNRGKEIAQGAHAAMAWLTKYLKLVPAHKTCFDAHYSVLFVEWIKMTFLISTSATSS